MLSTACGSRRCATSSAELRRTRSDRVSVRVTSRMIVAASRRPSIRITELTPARLLDRSSAAAPASTRPVVTAAVAASTCSAVRVVTSSHASAVTEIGPGSGAARMADFAASARRSRRR